MPCKEVRCSRYPPVQTGFQRLDQLHLGNLHLSAMTILCMGLVSFSLPIFDFAQLSEEEWK